VDPAHGTRPRLDARVTAYLIEQRARTRSLELAQARLEGELAASERIERAAQRYADKLEERLAEARKREASLARALGYVEAQRDLLAARLGEGDRALLDELEPALRSPDKKTTAHRAGTPAASG
jgi:hypothetical protein